MKIERIIKSTTSSNRTGAAIATPTCELSCVGAAEQHTCFACERIHAVKHTRTHTHTHTHTHAYPIAHARAQVFGTIYTKKHTPWDFYYEAPKALRNTQVTSRRARARSETLLRVFLLFHC